MRTYVLLILKTVKPQYNKHMMMLKHSNVDLIEIYAIYIELFNQ